MMVPVRCFTCGAVVASHWETFHAAVEAGTEPKKALDDTGLTRFCCRRMLVATKPLVQDAAPYE